MGTHCSQIANDVIKQRLREKDLRGGGMAEDRGSLGDGLDRQRAIHSLNKPLPEQAGEQRHRSATQQLNSNTRRREERQKPLNMSC